jgi:hypothetical protein
MSRREIENFPCRGCGHDVLIRTRNCGRRVCGRGGHARRDKEVVDLLYRYDSGIWYLAVVEHVDPATAYPRRFGDFIERPICLAQQPLRGL